MPLSSGRLLGPYEILSPIASGGMGEVYRASDPRLGREVAVKVLSNTSRTNLEAISRFESEARAVAALSHPNILAAYDYGVESGIAYVVTELLEGETLRSRINRSPLPWRKAVEIAGGIADGLAAAHEKGIVHRDMKPENVFLTFDGRVKILDFGLAHNSRGISPLPTPVSATERVHTPPDVIIGTVNYMSPEQLRAEPIDGRTDIFALGCVLYEMITGSPPFERDTRAETMAAILKEDAAETTESGIKIPLELDRIVGRCLEKNREQRFQSARDLAFALRAMAQSSSTSQVPLLASQRDRRITTAATLALLVIASVVAVLVMQMKRDPARQAIESLAVLPFTNLSGNENTDYLSDGLTESLINSLSQLPNLRVMSQSSVFRYKGSKEDPEEIARKLGVQAVLVGRIKPVGNRLAISAELVDTRDRRQVWGDQYAANLSDLFQVQEQIARQISDRLRLKLSGDQERRLAKRHTSDKEAYHHYLQGRFYWNKRNEEGLNKGIYYFKKAIERDPSYALAYAGLADSYAILSGYTGTPPTESFPLAKEAAERALELDESLAEAHASLGLIKETYEWDWDGAVEEFERAIELNPNYSSAYHWYALGLAQQGKFRQALDQIQQALELDPLSLVINRNAARIHYFARDYRRAEEQLRRTLEMESDFGPALHDLAHTLDQQNRHEEALSLFRRNYELESATEDLAGIARVSALLGKRQEAEEILTSLERMTGDTYVSPYELALVYLALGKKDEAIRSLERGVDDRYPQLPWLKVEPMFDPLRDDPRFAALLTRMGL